MEFENTFSVKAPIDEVYRTLLDVERVAPCLPGAQVLEQTGEDAYKVAIKVKVGPVTQQYRGDVEVVERDEAAHVAILSAKAREARGQGTANARVRMSLTEAVGQTHGTIASDVQLSGKAAAMGQRMVKDVSTKLIDAFSANLEAMLAADGSAAAPAQARTPASSPAEAKRSMPAEAQGETPAAAAEASPAEAGAGGASAKTPPAQPAVPGDPASVVGPGPSALHDASVESSGAAQSGSIKLQADAAAASGVPVPSPARERVEAAVEPRRPPAAEPEGLDVLPLLGSVIAGRLSDPRVALSLAVAVFLAGLTLGRRSAR